MDTLPELRSDADVDALMARIHARLAQAATPGSTSSTPASAVPGSGALASYVAAQEHLAATVLRALRMVAESLEELEADSVKSSPPRAPRLPRPARKGSRRRRT